jgi:hypothetical protein
MPLSGFWPDGSILGGLMRIRALLIACLVVIASLIALPADAAGSIQFRKFVTTRQEPTGVAKLA